MTCDNSKNRAPRLRTLGRPWLAWSVMFDVRYSIDSGGKADMPAPPLSAKKLQPPKRIRPRSIAPEVQSQCRWDTCSVSSTRDYQAGLRARQSDMPAALSPYP